jgi:hypothetical protein
VRDEIALLTQLRERIPGLRNVKLHVLLDDRTDELDVFVRVLPCDLLLPHQIGLLQHPDALDDGMVDVGEDRDSVCYRQLEPVGRSKEHVMPGMAMLVGGGGLSGKVLFPEAGGAGAYFSSEALARCVERLYLLQRARTIIATKGFRGLFVALFSGPTESIR